MKTTQLDRKSSAGPPTQEQPQHEDHGSFPLQNATTVSGRPHSPQATHRRDPGPNGRPLQPTDVNSQPRHVPEDDISEGSTGECHANSATPNFSHCSSEVTRLELERQLSASLTERDQHITKLTDELALKTALLEQVEANAVEAGMRAGPELRKHVDGRRLMQTSLVKQSDVELVETQARLRDMQAKLDELLISRDQQIGQYEKELTNSRSKLEANESELEAVRLRLTDAEMGLSRLTKIKTEADTSRAQTATDFVNTDGYQVIRRLMERVRAIEAESRQSSGMRSIIELMECCNE